LLFGKCLNNKAKISDFEKLLSYVNSYKIPKFPISGNYLKEKYGYESGVELGKHLKLLEDKWVKNNFVIDKDIIKNSLN
jgi:tRNA nucleotidyltransferase/poly(A) polymerase